VTAPVHEEVVPDTTNFSKTEPVIEAVVDDELPAIALDAEPFTAEAVEIGNADTEVALAAVLDEQEPADAFRLEPTPEFLATSTEEDIDPLIEAERAIAAAGPVLDFEAEPVVDLGGYELTPSPILEEAANLELDAASAEAVAVDPGPALDFDAPPAEQSGADDFTLTPAPILDESATPDIEIDGSVGELSLAPDDHSLSFDFDAPEPAVEVAAAEPEPVAAISAETEPPIVTTPEPQAESITIAARVETPLAPQLPDPQPASDDSDPVDVLSIVPPVLESKRKPLDKHAARKSARRPPKSVEVLEGMLRGIAIRRIEMASEHNQYNQTV